MESMAEEAIVSAENVAPMIKSSVKLFFEHK